MATLQDWHRMSKAMGGRIKKDAKRAEKDGVDTTPAADVEIKPSAEINQKVAFWRGDSERPPVPPSFSFFFCFPKKKPPSCC
jgi:hypothetical protein